MSAALRLSPQAVTTASVAGLLPWKWQLPPTSARAAGAVNKEASRAAAVKMVFMMGSFKVLGCGTGKRDGGSEAVAAGVFGVFDIEVLVRVAVFGGGEAEVVRVDVVLVAVQLGEQQVKASIKQG